jgi:hypothetical protein
LQKILFFLIFVKKDVRAPFDSDKGCRNRMKSKGKNKKVKGQGKIQKWKSRMGKEIAHHFTDSALCATFLRRIRERELRSKPYTQGIAK